MKKIFTLLALTIAFSMNAQMDDNSAIHSQVLMLRSNGNMHNSKWNCFYSNGMNTTASGDVSTAMGRNTTASGDILQQWEITQQQVIMAL